MVRVFVLFLLFTFNTFAAIPEPGKEYFTVQIASFKRKSDALKVLKTVEDLPSARISYRNGRYKVRVGFFKSFQEAKDFVKREIESKVQDYYITKIKFSPENVFFAKKSSFTPDESPDLSGSTFEEKNSSSVNEKEGEKTTSNVSGNSSKSMDIPDEESNGFLNSTENSSQSFRSELSAWENETMEMDSVCEGNSSGTDRGVENVTSSTLTNLAKMEKSKEEEVEKCLKNKNYGYFLALVFLTFLFYIFKRERRAPSNDLEKIIVRLVEEGKCDELVETVLPLLSVQEENTFLRKSLADCYLKQGKFLEAASLYEEIGEILDRKGLSVLADEFRKRAEEFYGSEFKRRG